VSTSALRHGATTGRVVQISVSPGGVPKTPVVRAAVSALGVEGDRHRDHAHHGGPDRAVCLYATEAIAALRAEGHPVFPGALGENLTVEGLVWEGITPGVRLAVGPDVVLEITSYTSPCANVAVSFADRNYGRISQKRHPGWSRLYARVIATGTVTTGDPIGLLETPGR
jgi:MOSC domain-containing protein YiiM